jgi:hypothetical protein
MSRNPHFQVDDILCMQWGWGETMIDFFQVLATSAHGVTLRQLNQHEIGTPVYQDRRGEVTARTKDFVTRRTSIGLPGPFRKKVTIVNGRPVVSFNSHRSFAEKWDGLPKTKTWGR